MGLHWGIVGAGKISHDFVCAVKTLPDENHQVVAIAARSLNSAKEFAELHNITTAYEGYEALANDNSIDIVYIGNLNPQHLSVSKLMLQHGKHVLCEKPLTMNKKQTQEIINYAKERKLFLMEAVWSRCFPAYEEMKKVIEEGTIGDVLHISVEFGYPLEHVERVNVREMGGSATLDLGVYVLQFSQYIYRGLHPVSVSAWGGLNEHEIDNKMSAIIVYPEGKCSTVSVSTVVQLSNSASVYGTKGMIMIPNFWCPDSFTVRPSRGSTFTEKTFTFDLPKTSAKFKHLNSAGLAYEAEEARQCILRGALESSKITHAESLELAELMDKLRNSAGCIFPEDS